MHARLAFVLVLALIAGCSSPAPPPPAAWTESDTVDTIRRDWDGCIQAGTEDACMARARVLASMLPPTVRPLTSCFALCNSNVFCDSGIIRQCRVCGFGGTCTTSLPQSPAP